MEQQDPREAAENSRSVHGDTLPIDTRLMDAPLELSRRPEIVEVVAIVEVAPG